MKGLGFTPTADEIEGTDRLARDYENGLFIDWALRRGDSIRCRCVPTFNRRHDDDGFHWLIQVTHSGDCPAVS
jgi:hypothetical protein